MQLKKFISKPKPKPVFNDADVQRVMELGYSKPVSVYALEACNGDVHKACDMLLEYGFVLLSLALFLNYGIKVFRGKKIQKS